MNPADAAMKATFKRFYCLK